MRISREYRWRSERSTPGRYLRSFIHLQIDDPLDTYRMFLDTQRFIR